MLDIAESPAALEWKRRKLNNGAAAPLPPSQPEWDDIWAPDALTKAFNAAVLDFQVSPMRFDSPIGPADALTGGRDRSAACCRHLDQASKVCDVRSSPSLWKSC